jgi:type III pantothenate kinase
MLLAIDAGNSHLKLALYRTGVLVAHWRVEADPDRTSDEYAMLWKQLFRFHEQEFSSVSGVVIACVVPPLMGPLRQLCRDYFHLVPLEIGPGIRTDMRILYDNPRELGADRIASAIALYNRYGGPAIAVDLGTATKFNVVSAEGDFLGGAIAPGIGISINALEMHAAQLRRIEIVHPPSIIAHTTTTAMQSGILHGYAAQVDGFVERVREELGVRATAVVTGGFGELPLLTLEGLRILHERNNPVL